jgi:hypothetical protein
MISSFFQEVRPGARVFLLTIPGGRTMLLRWRRTQGEVALPRHGERPLNRFEADHACPESIGKDEFEDEFEFDDEDDS